MAIQDTIRQGIEQTHFYESLTLPGARTRGPTPPVISAIPTPVPLVTGSRVLIWKRDPTVADPGVRGTFIPTLVLDGPRDNRVAVLLTGTTPVHANTNRDLTCSSTRSSTPPPRSSARSAPRAHRRSSPRARARTSNACSRGTRGSTRSGQTS